MRAGRLLLFAAAAGVFLVGPRDVRSCGFMSAPLFTYVRQPLPFLKQYARGDLGVIHPGYYRRYLLVAYRSMAGPPLAAEEQTVVAGDAGSEWLDRVKEWREARAKIPGVAPVELDNVDRNVPGSSWQTYPNCGQDAFHTAAETLSARAASLGANHAGLRSWVEAQDVVFSNCTGGERIPADPTPDLPAILKADRAYQIAAARFYAGKLDDAEKEFRAIAGDRASPWSTIAPYLAARCLIRRATLSAAEGEFDRRLLEQAAGELRSVLADEARRPVHPAAKRLLDFVRARVAPGERLEEVAAALLDARRAAEFGRNLTDFELLLDRGAGSKPEDARAAGDLIDWIRAFQSARPGSGGAEYAVARWESTRSTPWLVAALAAVGAGHPRVAALLVAAEQVPAGSSAYPTVLYHRLRLLIDAARLDEARAELDRVLPRLRASLPRSSLNMFRAVRMKLALSLDELLRNAPRQPDGVLLFAEEPPPPDGSASRRPLFDADAVWVFNRFLPLARLEQAAASPLLPTHLRAEVAGAAFVRAVLTGADRAAGAMSDLLARLHPELAPLAQAYRAAPAGPPRQFAAVYLLLKTPALKPYLREGEPRPGGLFDIDSMRDNWWCSAGEGMREGVARREALPPPAAPGFLSEAERGALERELERLTGLPTGQSYLAEAVLAWTNQNPSDPRVPEALHLVVKSTRYGCNDDNTGRLSKAAFTLLHTRYPGSSWTAGTPYWFR